MFLQLIYLVDLPAMLDSELILGDFLWAFKDLLLGGFNWIVLRGPLGGPDPLSPWGALQCLDDSPDSGFGGL